MTEGGKNMWAPWRLEYIRDLDNQHDGCFLCDYWRQGELDEPNLVLCRGSHSLVLLNRYPYNNGHLMIAPARHVARLDDLAEAELLELMLLTRDWQRVLAGAFKAQGFNFGANVGQCAGAGLPGHLHLHVVPRWAGDTNYMAVIGDVRVIPQSLAETWRQLRMTAEELDLCRQAGEGR